ncbi:MULTISPECIES: hypothetical protein [unclassified Haladaptatus]|uniref:hypothetical protein n=1 Tax=unclassified Haladaptatus TaxID=2622732 RepID=UPI0023E8E918|nr:MULTISPECIES: hypothetical protein [unclassified Haladaptatus]
MRLTPDAVREERDWVKNRASVVVPLVNDVREKLGAQFDVTVEPIIEAAYRDAVDEVFADGTLAVNVAGIVAILRDLDCEGDYPGFVVDELLGRELAAMIAGNQPFHLLGQATFHFADVHTHTSGVAGADDLDAALAAGFQTRLPGWSWTEGESPFSVTD